MSGGRSCGSGTGSGLPGDGLLLLLVILGMVLVVLGMVLVVLGVVLVVLGMVLVLLVVAGV